MRFKTILILPFVLICSACSTTPHADVDIRQEDHDFVFQIRTRSINGLLDLRLWQVDTKEIFWDINLNYYKEPELRYGEVPDKFTTFNGGQNRAEQNIPRNHQRPRPLPANQNFYLALDCQYDTILAAASKVFYFSFSTDKNGRISRVTRVEHITSDAIPR